MHLFALIGWPAYPAPAASAFRLKFISLTLSLSLPVFLALARMLLGLSPWSPSQWGTLARARVARLSLSLSLLLCVSLWLCKSFPRLLGERYVSTFGISEDKAVF